MNAAATTMPHAVVTDRPQRGSAIGRSAADAPSPNVPRLWGLDTVRLHDLYWASRGVCVVRRAQSSEIEAGAPAYLLLEPHQLALFDVPRQAHRLRCRRAALRVTILEGATEAAPEQFDTDEAGRIIAIRRLYRTPAGRLTTVLMTGSVELARRWQSAADGYAGRRAVHRAAGLKAMRAAEAHGWTGRCTSGESNRAARTMLLRHWRTPSDALGEVREVSPGIWAHHSATIAESARLIAPLWIGAGNIISPHEVVAGPQVLGDAPGCAAETGAPNAALRVVGTLDTTDTFAPGALRDSIARRVFDIIFSSMALALATPVMAVIALAILIDDGRPVIFAHKRQTLGAREFNCYKFRTMRRDAEALKAMFDQQNICDGPQFHIRNDPRETRVGRWLRRFHLDELPQFFNVLAGHMSVIGPRPSPEAENRYCPAWRHARLSVKSGVTGLWQVRRTRAPYTDFQEWIRYDTEYVNRRSWRLDLWIMFRTLQQMILRK